MNLLFILAVVLILALLGAVFYSLRRRKLRSQQVEMEEQTGENVRSFEPIVIHI